MEIYEFKNMEDVSAETLIERFESIFDYERMRTFLFEENEYEWHIGVNVYMKIKNTLDLYPYPCGNEIDKFLGIDLKVFAPGVMSTAICLSKKNSNGIAPFKRYLNSIYGTKMFEIEDKMMDGIDAMRYVAYDMISLSKTYNNMFEKDTPKKVIFNDPATIVYWKDGTKTVVKAEGESFDPEKGLAMAIAKRHLGNKGNYYDIFKEWLPKYKVPEEQLLEKTDDSTDVALSFDILTADEFAKLIGEPLINVTTACELGVYKDKGAKKIMGEWLIPYLKTSEV